MRARVRQGKHVVVTGAGTGIGRAVAQRLVDEGARVSALARSVERLDVGEPHVCDIRDRRGSTRSSRGSARGT